MVGVAAPVVAHGRPDVFWHRIDASQQIVDRLRLQFRMLLERRIQIVDVGRVMLVVMNPHRLLVDMRLELVVVVGQGGN